MTPKEFRLASWLIGKKRRVDSIVYVTKKEARMARANKRLHKEFTNGREKADSSAP